MRKVIALLCICFLSMEAKSQVTESQKQEALAAASQFCNLLSQFSNGGTQYLGNDQKIFALCSSRNISAFDDIQQNKEVLLSSYLSIITKMYRNKLSMSFSTPQIKESYSILGFDVDLEDGEILLESLTPKIEQIGISDVYIIMKVMQDIPSLSKHVEKFIIFSVEEHKIISFSTISSPYIAFCKGGQAYMNHDFSNALKYYEEAGNSSRFSKKETALQWACYSAVMDKDKNGIIRLIKKEWGKDSGNKLFYKGLAAYENEEYILARSIMEEAIKTDFILKPRCEIRLATLYSAGLGGNVDRNRALSLLKDAADNWHSAHAAFVLAYNGIIFHSGTQMGVEISNDDITRYMIQAGEGNWEQAYPYLCRWYSSSNVYEAGKWAQKSAYSGNSLGMAMYGKIIVDNLEDSRDEGIKWLKKSIATDGALEKEISKMLIKIDWPNSKQDVLSLLSKYDGGTYQESTVNTQQNTNQTAYDSSSSSSTYNNYSNSNSYSSNSNHSDYRYENSLRNKRSFNSPHDNYFIGFSAGYVQKQWTFDFKDGGSEKVGFWDDSKKISGVQAGIRVNPQFVYGFGLNTGLYYEFYYSKSDRMNYTDDYGQYTGTLQEHALYLPVHLEYRMNFSKYFQLFFYGGIGLDYGLANSIKWVDCDDDSYSETINNIYDSDDCPDWQRFNYSLEYGGGIRTSCFQLNFTMSKGLRNMSSTDEYKVYQGKNLMLSLSIML